jgi:hypothetical protein
VPDTTSVVPQVVVQKKKRPTKNYINKEEFLSELVKYRKNIEEASLHGKPVPRMPDVLGKTFLVLCQRMATMHNFRNYTFIEDMVADGYENCVKVALSFDPEKSQNPFGYFSQVVWRAFLRRIKAEKKFLKVRVAAAERASIFGELSSVQDGDDSFYASTFEQTEKTLDILE